MEFEVKTDLSVLPAVIESNAPEIRAEMDQKLEFYRNLVVTPETVNDGKKAKADLNKLKTAIADKRKEVKRQCLDPYKAFEDACKEIEGMIDDAVESIDKQLKEFARQVATEKLNVLQAHFNGIVSEKNAEWIDINRILNPKWKNSTMKLDVLKREISEAVDRLLAEEAELQSIYAMSPLYPAIWGKYLETYDKGQTLAYAAVLIQQEQQRQPAPPTMPEPVPQPVSEPVPIPEKNEPIGTCAFRVIGTRTQIMALRKYMEQNAIRFEVVKNKEE